MSTTAFKSAPKAVSRDTCRSGEVPGDWERWLETRGETDDLRQERLRRGLRRARREELTERQRQVLALCYDQGLSVTEAASAWGSAPPPCPGRCRGPGSGSTAASATGSDGAGQTGRFLLYFFPVPFIMEGNGGSPRHKGG